MKPIRNLTRAGVLAGTVVIGVVGLALAPVAHADTVIVKEPVQTLKGWQTTDVPDFQCPQSHPYLLDQNYAPFGIAFSPGIQVSEGTAHPWPIVPWIGQASRTSDGYAGGVGVGYVTNWALTDRWYAVLLHCTDNASQGYPEILGHNVGSSVASAPLRPGRS